MAVEAGVRVWRAPGRVNLIGEHTDYNDGFVLPCAIGLECQISARSVPGNELQVYSAAMDSEKSWPLDQIRSLEPRHDWSDYVAGVAKELLAAGFALRPVRLEIKSTVPPGSGLSSSAALEVATALALLDGRAIERLDLAKLCQRAERNFVGMPCGIMDQYTSVFGQARAAILIDCRSLEHRTVQLPEGVDIIAVNTMVKHELGQSAYRQRVAECEEALQHFPGSNALRDVSVGPLEARAGQIAAVPLARARHVVTEDLRVEKFLAASEERNLATMGKLFVESHRSLQHDYEVSCDELDFLVDTALGLSGVFGARMTGGGFGGCTVNLVESGRAGEFGEAISARYLHRFGKDPAIYRCVPSTGAGPLS